MSDPLAAFRKTKAPTPQAPVAAKEQAAGPLGKEPYAAYATRDKNRSSRLEIRPKDGLAHAVSYAHLYEIVWDRRTHATVYLIFNSLSVQIHGRGLRPIVEAIKLGSADFIAQFDENEHEGPTDETAPFIEHIKVVSAAEVRAGKAAKG